MRKFIENKFAILFYGLQVKIIYFFLFISFNKVLTNDKLNLLRKWLPSWADTSFFELTKLYIPIKYRNIQICEYNILTTGDKVDTEPEWLKINRLNYAVIHGYCYFHFSCKSACNCKFPHFWRYLAVIELYEIVEQVKLEFNTMSYLSTPFVLYMDTDIMFTNYSFKIEYIHQCISDSSLFFAVDDNCKSSLYPINVGVILASLNNYDTILFCYSVLTLQRNHFILNHTSHWGSSGLNDQPIVMQLLNDTGRINIKVINEYCSTQTSTSQNLFNINVPVEKPGVSVIPSRYLNSITRSEDWILYKDKEELRTIQGWDKNSWTCHFSGANSSTIPFLIWNICNELQTEQKFGFICPYNLNKILTIEYLEITEKDERRRLHILSYPNYLFLRESTKFVSSIENVKIMFLKLSFAYSDILIK
ncbi:uncharacterized protein CMU_031410 [Cryptosporidium muris RN66]|uniref:Uncharacterized protein n=1 Tax=Cryptosporidium muris (strain RN66) TaxID=441375 RepID=B6AIF9_CRYMR|nr:uncharacterized protein CMU_031410 [Cryptosporidium muris RN66]EEA08000.1 hypothetical protein, conserved [Cryptosporidium muris RN66]|eukprot:XP_002142349.1 hypothetical protein [Cryptosporidium muris RN66]